MFQERGFRPEQVYVDSTRGTKAMSAAIDYVAVNLELGGVSYIEGERDERGQVISGTERLSSFRPLELLFRRHWRTLVQLFNAGHFASVLNRIEDLQPWVVRPDHRRRLDFIAGLARACEAWDTLRYEAACQGFQGLMREFRDLVQDLGLHEDLQRANDVVHGIWHSRCRRSDCGCGLLLDPRTALDLLANADRRAAEHRYDVAVALLYRLMEYMAQHRLHERGLRSDNVRLERLPEAVRAKWVSRVDVDARLRVGMVQGYELLADLEDDLGRRFLSLYQAPTSPLKPYLESRNMSPLAHGFQPVGQDVFEKLRAVITDEFLSKLVPDWRNRLAVHRLPRLPEA